VTSSQNAKNIYKFEELSSERKIIS